MTRKSESQFRACKGRSGLHWTNVAVTCKSLSKRGIPLLDICTLYIPFMLSRAKHELQLVILIRLDST